MSTTNEGRSRLLWVYLLVLLFSACAHSPTPEAPSTPAATQAEQPLGPYEGQTVTAVVERLELMAHTESFDDGSVMVSNLLWFGIVQPERFDTMLMVVVKGHPHINGRPLLLGEAVRFVLPRNWRARELTLEDLQGLEFARKADGGQG